MSLETTRWWRSSSRSSVLSLLVVALAVALPAAEARASACGGNMITYAVFGPDMTPTNGIRCVAMPTSKPAVGRGRILWYGEGNWGAGNYRHIGSAWEGQGIGGAADISGNGEPLWGKTSNLRVSFTDPASPPHEIVVKGDWNEIWRRTDDAPWTLLPRPVTCGPNYETYVVGNTAGWQGGGIRCLPKNSFDSTGDHPWLGFGDWNGSTYNTLGIRMSDGTVLGYGLCGLDGKVCDGNLSASSWATGAWPWVRLDLSGGYRETWERVTTATYSSTYKAPDCFDLFANGYQGCTSGATLKGRGPLGPEANASNTLDGCADGTAGTYHSDESIDGISVTVVGNRTADYTYPVRVDARIWAYSSSSDYVDFYYAPDARNPVWTLIGTAQPATTGESTVSVTFNVPQTAFLTRAVRAQLRYYGTAAACVSGAYNDHDDLVFGLGLEW